MPKWISTPAGPASGATLVTRPVPASEAAGQARLAARAEEISVERIMGACFALAP